MGKELSRITIDIPINMHKKFKAFAAKKGKTMRELVVDLIKLQLCVTNKEEECPYNHEPNQETIEAINNVKKKKNIVRAKDAKDLLKKLGLEC
jgi:antitoxin component of RelBE/YafQ-DinJ toxin-antitoxin module